MSRNYEDYILGRPVTEEYVAKELGFADVHDMRRWDSDRGRAVLDMEYKLEQSQGDAERFRWEGSRMMVVLDKAEDMFNAIIYGADPTTLEIEKLLLAIGVACGREADWGGTLKDWWPETPKERTP